MNKGRVGEERGGKETDRCPLTHVVGTYHGPDGLSRRPCQDGDDEEKNYELDFKDWIDQLHRFMHQIT
jgi:hypothetical protein